MPTASAVVADLMEIAREIARGSNRPVAPLSYQPAHLVRKPQLPLEDAFGRYYLRFGGRDVCEVLCTSGRYDMDLLAGNEVGVFGDEILGTSAQGEVVDVRRLEILKRR